MAIVPARIRFDDILTNSNSPRIKGRELEKFLKNLSWCRQLDVPLTPAILCENIEQFPKAIKILQKMTKEGIIYPDLHGYDHGPYSGRSSQEVDEHLDKSLVWFKKNLGVLPIRWVTPHGADSPIIQASASKFNLVVETTDPPVIDQKVLTNKLRATWDINIIKDRIIMNHFWERGLRLYRIAKIIKYQSINEAIAATKKELNPKEHRICWGGWQD